MWGAVILSLEADKTEVLNRSKPQFPGCSMKLEFNCDSFFSPDMLNFVTHIKYMVRDYLLKVSISCIPWCLVECEFMLLSNMRVATLVMYVCI